MLCCAFVLPEERAPRPVPNKYFEIVVHTPDCKGNECFTEFIFLSNGIAIRKLPVTGKENGRLIEVRQAGVQQTAALFAQVETFFTSGIGPGNPGKAQDQLFYYDGEKYYAYNAFTPAPAEMGRIFDDSGGAFNTGKGAEDFFLHTYWQPLKGGTKSLHAFADGTVIDSMFVRQTSSIVYTSMSQLKAGDFEKLRTLAAAASAAPEKKYMKCGRETGLDYGFVEFQNAGAYARSFACGEGGNLFSPILTHMRDNYGDAK